MSSTAADIANDPTAHARSPAAVSCRPQPFIAHLPIAVAGPDVAPVSQARHRPMESGFRASGPVDDEGLGTRCARSGPKAGPGGE